MGKVTGQRDKVAALSSLVAKERSSKKKARYSDQTKSLVRTLVKSGVKPGVLTAATGIAGSTIFKWTSANGDEVAADYQELEIVDKVADSEPAYPVLLRLKTAYFEVTIYSSDREA